MLGVLAVSDETLLSVLQMTIAMTMAMAMTIFTKKMEIMTITMVTMITVWTWLGVVAASKEG